MQLVLDCNAATYRNRCIAAVVFAGAFVPSAFSRANVH